jgi:LysM repeat protein
MIRLKSLLSESKLPEKYVQKGIYLAKQLMSRGFSKDEASAIVGNAWAESSFNPAKVGEGGDFGLLQWLGSRKTSLEDFSKKRKKPATDLTVQLDFIKYELKDAYGGTDPYEVNNFISAMAKDTIAAKAYAFAKIVERPDAAALEKSKGTRMEVAQQIYNALTNKSADTDSNKTVAPASVGKTIYPLKKNGYVNVREDAVVDSGIFDNLLTTIKYPTAVGVVKSITKGEDGKTWYQVKLASGKVGYVRSDVVTTTNEALYTVQAGDTLTKISKQTGLSIDKIKQLNKLTSDTIQVGQKLKLY